VSGDARLDFLVSRQDLRACRVDRSDPPAPGGLAPGRVRLRIERFAFTANNITYAVFGDAMSYWKFFPAPEGWGRIPVWGFATAEATNHAAVAAGDRFYGYLPMSTHVEVEPDRADAAGFFDGAAHRRPLHAVYNQYLRTSTDPGYDPGTEAQQMLLRPLFTTSFLIDDFLADNAFFGARTVILSSASSKTAYGLAFLLAQRGRDACEVVGLTSAANRAFVERLGCYHRVLTYDQLATLPADRPAVYVDMSGDAGVRATLHHHLLDALRHDCAVGGTHWDRVGQGERLPGPRPTLFFAPARFAVRAGDWGGGAAVSQRIATAWTAFLSRVRGDDGWMQVLEAHGPVALEQVYREVLEGRARPEQGHLLSLQPR